MLSVVRTHDPLCLYLGHESLRFLQKGTGRFCVLRRPSHRCHCTPTKTRYARTGTRTINGERSVARRPLRTAHRSVRSCLLHRVNLSVGTPFGELLPFSAKSTSPRKTQLCCGSAHRFLSPVFFFFQPCKFFCFGFFFF